MKNRESEHLVRLVVDGWAVRAQGRTAIRRRQQDRLADIVSFARARSPLYRELYQGLPERVTDPELLPVVDKRSMMSRLGEWVTDPAVTAAGLHAFVNDPAMIGEPFLDRYTVTTTSGTTGAPGIFLQDRRSLTVTAAMGARMLAHWLSVTDVARIVAGGGRMAMVTAAGGHFATAVAAARLRKSRMRRRRILTLSVQRPINELVEQLNAFQPVILAPYASTGALLAREQSAKHLRINPVLVVLAAEGLPPAEFARVDDAFGGIVRHSYAATECMFLSYSCRENWLHVNNDWVILEPVDADHRPVPAGQQSHTVLLTNLANRVQPILRYDLGDSILVRPEPCPCGDPGTPIRVHGRAGDVLVFRTRTGIAVSVSALAFSATIDTIPGVQLFQLIQASPADLQVRLLEAPGSEPADIWRSVQAAIARILSAQGLDHVTVSRASEPPQPSTGGKYRSVVPYQGTNCTSNASA